MKVMGYTVKEAAEKTGLDERQIIYRIRRKHIEAQKVGWIWLITERGLEQLSQIAQSERVRLPNGVEDIEE